MMNDGPEELRGCIQDALDEICSPRTSPEARTRALEQLEKQMAISCLVADKNTGSWDSFLALQYTFECNVPSRLIAWISMSTAKLEQVASKGTPDERTLVLQLAKALSLIQGIVLSHDSSKSYLSRKYSLEVLLELLLTSRHLTTANESDRSSSTRNKQAPELPLTSSVLDTLLCILVDAPSALRVFENVNGVQAVVRILKRAGTPREVRMKCLEFLYFYLLDETVSNETSLTQRSPSILSTFSTAVSHPGTPSPQQPLAHLSKPSLNSTPRRPLARHGSGSSESSSSSSSSRSTSSSSVHSFTSLSSISTPASSMTSSPEKPIRLSQLQSSSKTPFHLPRSTLKFPAPQHQRNAMMMLRKDVDYEPLSPMRSSFGERVSTPSSRPRAQTHGQFYTPSRSTTHSSKLSISLSENESRGGGEKEKRKTTEEKKQLLGTMLGNVDALVEGVRKAGIWGLG